MIIYAPKTASGFQKLSSSAIEIGNNSNGGAFFTLQIPHKKLGS